MSKNNRNLFVCVGNVDRSKAGEDVFRIMLQERGFRVGSLNDRDNDSDFYVGSAGIRPSTQNIMQGSIQLTQEMTTRANIIFSLDAEVTNVLIKDYKVRPEKLIPLYVEDGRSLIIDEQAQSLYAEFRRRLEEYLPRR